MKLAVAIFAGMLLTLTTASAKAEPVDCEAARCTVQSTIDLECPCAEAKNHGRYTSCVSRVLNRLVREGLVPKKCRTKIQGCAIRSTCGKRDGSVSCQLRGPATTSRCRPLSSESTCTSRGGTVVASCCESCSAPVPTASPTEAVPTPTATEEPVATVTETPAPVETETPEPVATATETPVPTATETDQPVVTATPEPVATETPGPVATETPGPVVTQTAGPVATETALPTATPVAPTATATEVAPTATITAAPEATATVTAVPTVTATITAVPTATVTAVPTTTATGTATPVPTTTVTPTATPVPTATGTPLPEGFCSPPGSPTCPNAGNGLEFCSMQGTCLCPTRVQFSGDATDPTSLLDTGWTGIAHRAPIISNGDVTIALTNCEGSIRPCGTCTVTGPVANPGAGAGKLDNQRCSHDSSIKCTSNATCGAGNTCEFYFGGPLSLAAGGVSTCVFNQFNGPVTGTANVESGEAVTTAFLTSRVYNGLAIDNPCARCTDAGGINDGVNGGTCDGGTRVGLPCDANGEVPGRPDFGRTSLDCPLAAGGLIATLPINLSNETNVVTRTISADSPNCGPAAPGEKCLCQTCNNLASTPCFSNADCVAVGATICGGNRCIGGPTAGAPCASAATCGAGGLCGRQGEPTRPSACLDDTTTVNELDCDDPDGDGEGTCLAGPITNSCSVASGHAQRGCINDGDCEGAVGSCESTNRLCFTTGGGSFQPPGAKVGTDTLFAAGMEDPPMNDVSNPTLGAVFCVGPTGSASVNNVAGLPGPGRVTIKGTARGLP